MVLVPHLNTAISRKQLEQPLVGSHASPPVSNYRRHEIRSGALFTALPCWSFCSLIPLKLKNWTDQLHMYILPHVQNVDKIGTIILYLLSQTILVRRLKIIKDSWSAKVLSKVDGNPFSQLFQWHCRSRDVKCPTMSEIIHLSSTVLARLNFYNSHRLANGSLAGVHPQMTEHNWYRSGYLNEVKTRCRHLQLSMMTLVMPVKIFVNLNNLDVQKKKRKDFKELLQIWKSVYTTSASLFIFFIDVKYSTERRKNIQMLI